MSIVAFRLPIPGLRAYQDGSTMRTPRAMIEFKERCPRPTPWFHYVNSLKNDRERIAKVHAVNRIFGRDLVEETLVTNIRYA